MQYHNSKIKLSGSDRYKNFMPIDGYDRELVHLEEGPPGGEGGNSSVFRVLPADEFGPEYVIKFCNYPEDAKSEWESRRVQRFEREIDANKKATKASLKSEVVELVVESRHVIGGKSFRYFVMPKADCNLGVFLENEALSQSSKLLLCHKIFEAVHRLHEIEIYHRDIKPANFMMFNSTVRVGDLGLCAYRDEDGELDKGDRKIGPFGFLSPEAVNRGCANGRSQLFGKMCKMDAASDFFQLGLLFWFILQGDVPVGQLASSDLSSVDNRDVFEKVIVPLLQFDKKRRPAYNDLTGVLRELAQV